jgi:hypothetical protein
MGLVQPTTKCVFCPATDAYAPIESCRGCAHNEGFAFARGQDHHKFGVICGRSIDGYIPEPIRAQHKLTLQDDDSWQ